MYEVQIHSKRQRQVHGDLCCLGNMHILLSGCAGSQKLTQDSQDCCAVSQQSVFNVSLLLYSVKYAGEN